MKNFLLVFFGGGFGSAIRYAISRVVGNQYSTFFPYATLITNVVACFILGFIVGLAEEKQFLTPSSKIFWTVGFCGGFSTFSTFSNETLNLLQQGAPLTSLLYIFFSVSLCVGAVVLGQVVARQF